MGKRATGEIFWVCDYDKGVSFLLFYNLSKNQMPSLDNDTTNVRKKYWKKTILAACER